MFDQNKIQGEDVFLSIVKIYENKQRF